MAVSLGSALEKMLRKMNIVTPVRQWEAVTLWDSAVGKKIANHTKAEKIAYGKLYVLVDSPSWRNELLFHKNELLEKINSKLQGVKIKEIVLR
jgi:predicted nucleic acid-binding Zn ribbon protein